MLAIVLSNRNLLSEGVPFCISLYKEIPSCVVDKQQQSKLLFCYPELEFVMGRDCGCIGTHLVSFNSIHMHSVNFSKPFSATMDILIISN